MTFNRWVFLFFFVAALLVFTITAAKGEEPKWQVGHQFNVDLSCQSKKGVQLLRDVATTDLSMWDSAVNYMLRKGICGYFHTLDGKKMKYPVEVIEIVEKFVDTDKDKVTIVKIKPLPHKEINMNGVPDELWAFVLDSKVSVATMKKSDKN